MINYSYHPSLPPRKPWTFETSPWFDSSKEGKEARRRRIERRMSRE